MLMSKQPSTSNKLVSVLVVSTIGLSLIALIYFALKERIADKYRLILRNPYPTKGIVTERRSYKGKRIDVEYSVNGKQYEYKTGVDDQTYDQYQVGDTISLTVCKDDPSFALLTIQLKKSKMERFLPTEATDK